MSHNQQQNFNYGAWGNQQQPNMFQQSNFNSNDFTNDFSAFNNTTQTQKAAPTQPSTDNPFASNCNMSSSATEFRPDGMLGGSDFSASLDEGFDTPAMSKK